MMSSRLQNYKYYTALIGFLGSLSVFCQNEIIDTSTILKTKNTTTVNRQIKLTGEIISGTTISIRYRTLEGNNPLKNKNWIAIWQGSQIHYDEKPLRKTRLTAQNKDGAIAFDSLQISNLKYTVGFGSSNRISTASAVLIFPKKTVQGIPFSSSIEVINYGTNYVITKFSTPLGNSPLNNKNWVAIWEGKNPVTDCSNFLAKSFSTTNTNTGSVALNNLTLIRQTWYTVAYGAGENCKDIISTYSFLYP